ncbi:hypothetical protein [Gloeocapsa sp. PCC 73106]|uniref:hypothetical protein n=1 Tax=Gloeocapsa sp. PCC 73106 TaxID=102232 RepID=UPI0002AD12FE|nr:hypothetical protein [Gloeocapsa sp. PCC 73106]ELR99034.1 hypothetical protein GLO73106DRAFT_00028790 [Gloeocapsa sp. PCC 73106]
MTQHYVLTINPETEHPWEQCILRNPLTGERPDLTTVIAQAIDSHPGSYLVSVKIEVEVLEKVALDKTKTPVELRLRHLAAS